MPNGPHRRCELAHTREQKGRDLARRAKSIPKRDSSEEVHMSTSLVMRAILAAIVLSAAPAIAHAQAPQTKHARSTPHKDSKASVHHAKVEQREAHASRKTKKAKKRASSSRLPFPEHPNGKPRW